MEEKSNSSVDINNDQTHLSEEAPDPLMEMKDLLLRTQANFENYRKQIEQRTEEINQTAAKDFIIHLLPIMDNFELTLKNIDQKSTPENLLKGMELLYAQLSHLLNDHGVQPIITHNQLFNPYFHEALMKVESELPENTIIEEFQQGYLLYGKVLRHARVKISAGKKKTVEG